MPCAVSEGEKRAGNQSVYGVDMTFENMICDIACQAVGLIEAFSGDEGLEKLSPHAQKWWALHKKADAAREGS